MPKESTEIKVGLFVFVGLAILAALVVQFGRLGEGFQPSYEFTVEFPNASGLVKEANVLLAGARIGRAASAPEVLPDGLGVAVRLRVYESVKIPEGSTFKIGSSGLLGDRFVDVVPKVGGETFIQPGSTLKGKRESGMGELTQDGTDLIADLRGAVKNLNGVIIRLDQELLSEEMLKDLKGAIANLKVTTEKFSTAAGDVGVVIGKAGDTMDAAKKVFESADKVMAGADEAVATTGKAAEDLRLTLQDTRKAVNQLNTLLSSAQTGDGLVPALLNDPELAGEVQALVSNLRRSGVLFYKDRSGLENANGMEAEKIQTGRPAGLPRSR